ncbi:hypothetical protein GN956_G26888, partial [Arapaima gigas]
MDAPRNQNALTWAHEGSRLSLRFCARSELSATPPALSASLRVSTPLVRIPSIDIFGELWLTVGGPVHFRFSVSVGCWRFSYDSVWSGGGQ